MINSPTLAAVREIRILYSQYEHALFGRDWTHRDDEIRYSSYLWALETVEEMVLNSTEPPLKVIEAFGLKLEMYSNVNDRFSDCVVAIEQLIRTLV